MAPFVLSSPNDAIDLKDGPKILFKSIRWLSSTSRFVDYLQDNEVQLISWLPVQSLWR